MLFQSNINVAFIIWCKSTEHAVVEFEGLIAFYLENISEFHILSHPSGPSLIMGETPNKGSIRHAIQGYHMIEVITSEPWA